MSLKNLFHKEAREKAAAAAWAQPAALGISSPRSSPPPAARLAALGTSSPRKSLPPAARFAALGTSKL